MKSRFGNRSVVSRRRFCQVLGSTAAVASGPYPIRGRGLSEKSPVMGIGIGGKGRTDLQQSAQAGFEIRALVDVVNTNKITIAGDRRLRSIEQSRAAFPDAVFGTDYRDMIDRMGDRIDAVVVSTPDHHHFFASMQAMAAGKHVYCQKPLTHGIWEARMMARAARRYGVHTQMGNQAHATDTMQRCVELLRSGLIGKIKEIHAWTNRPIWPQGSSEPPPAEPVPAGLDWTQ